MSSLGPEAFRWDHNTGMQGLGDLPGGDFLSIAYSVSADGARVVGFGSTAFGREAVVWDSTAGMRRLHDLLTQDGGVDLTGWTLHEARSISADGRTIVGYGTNPSGVTEDWIARIERPEPVPEPGTWLLLGTGLLGVLGYRWHR